jgi:hypothetical protein
MEKCLSKNRFAEGEKNELYLPEDEPKAFSVVVEWIYRGKLPMLSSSVLSSGFDVLDLSAAYCMADKFGMEELQNIIVDCIRGSHRIMAASHAQGHAHTHTHHGQTSASARDSIRIGHGLISSLSSADRDALASSSVVSPEACRPNYAALSLCHLTGPPKSPLKRFFIEHLVYHMMMFPKYYHNDLTRNGPQPKPATTTAPAAAQTVRSEERELALIRDKAEFEKLFEIPELSLLIMRKIWQWSIEKWGDPSRDKACSYHVHSSTQCEYKKASGVNAQTAAAMAKARAGMSSSPNNPAALLQGLSGGARAGASWMGTSASHGGSTSSLGLGAWHPGVGW